MTSEIKIGAVFESKETLQAALLQLVTSTTKDFRVRINSATMYLVVCYSNKTKRIGKTMLQLVSGSYMPNPTVKANRMVVGL